jgi:membrane-associated phospholipid phosphatase
MHWLQNLDTHLFLFGNRSLANPFCDWLMPILSGVGAVKKEFIALAIVAGVVLSIFGKSRARVCVLVMMVVIAINDGLVCNPLKHAVARPRPFVTLPQARVFGKIGDGYVPPVLDANGVNIATNKGSHNSMPSSHAANIFAATMVLFCRSRSASRFRASTTACIIRAMFWRARSSAQVARRPSPSPSKWRGSISAEHIFRAGTKNCRR